MVRCRCVVWALALGLAGCGDDGPGAAPGSTGTTDAPTATMVSTSSSDGADETATTGTPSPTCDDSTPAFVDPLRLVGSDAPGLTGLVAVTAAGSFVYGCSHDAGLTVWSVADPAAPTVVATGLSAAADDPPRCDAVALSEDGSQLVTARRPIDGDGGVTVWTLGDPAMPSMQAHWATMLAVESAVMGAGRVWVAAGPDGVRSLALDLDQLVEQGSYVDEDSDARGLAIDGDMLLVAEAREGLRVYDVAPDEPVLQGTVGLGAVAVDVRISEDRAHVATLEAVAVVDIADPAAPDLIVQLPTQGPALDLTRHDDLLLVADWDEIR
ncbi:MAG: hypothetical protein K0V04_32385, partial [Deltaproteobacteria bacterium]|nr:hypothetical protein [Deltaproteobacteria bacterium]